MPVPAGAGHRSPALPARARPAGCCRCTAPAGSASAAARCPRGSPRRPSARRRRARSWSRSSSPGGIDSLSVLLRPRTRPITSCAPTLAVRRPRRDTPFTRGSEPQLGPGGGGVRPAPRRRQGDRVPGDRLQRPGPVALHLPPLLGGRRGRHAPGHRLDGPLPRPRRQPDQPPSGPVDGRRDEPDAGHRAQPGRGDRPPRVLLAVAPRTCGGTCSRPDARTPPRRSATPSAAPATPRSPRSPRPPPRSACVRRALAPFQTADGNAAYTSPVTYPKSASTDFPQRLAGPCGDDRRRSAIALRRAHPGAAVRHPLRPGADVRHRPAR